MPTQTSQISGVDQDSVMFISQESPPTLLDFDRYPRPRAAEYAHWDVLGSLQCNNSPFPASRPH
jgi:hypothetical protein